MTDSLDAHLMWSWDEDRESILDQVIGIVNRVNAEALSSSAIQIPEVPGWAMELMVAGMLDSPKLRAKIVDGTGLRGPWRDHILHDGRFIMVNPRDLEDSRFFDYLKEREQRFFCIGLTLEGFPETSLDLDLWPLVTLDLKIRNAPRFKRLDAGNCNSIPAHLTIDSCPCFEEFWIPEASGLKNLWLYKLACLQELPPGLQLNKLEAIDCPRLKLPPNLKSKELDLEGCPSIQEISPEFGRKQMRLAHLEGLQRVLHGAVDGLEAWDLPRLQDFSPLESRGQTLIVGCPELLHAPLPPRNSNQNAEWPNAWHIQDCPQLQSIPQGVVVASPPSRVLPTVVEPALRSIWASLEADPFVECVFLTLNDPVGCLEALRSRGVPDREAIQRTLQGGRDPFGALKFAKRLAKYSAGDEQIEALIREALFDLGIHPNSRSMSSEDETLLKEELAVWDGRTIFVCSGFNINSNWGVISLAVPILSRGCVAINECPRLVTLPPWIEANGFIQITRCPMVEHLPGHLEAKIHTELSELPRVQELDCRSRIMLNRLNSQASTSSLRVQRRNDEIPLSRHRDRWP